VVSVGVQGFVEGVGVEFCLYMEGGAKSGEEVLPSDPYAACGGG
jgi:hypothetical protein